MTEKRDNPLAVAALGAAGLLLALFGKTPRHQKAPAVFGKTPRLARHQGGAAQPGRGHDAAAPWEIPPRGWWDTLRRVGRQVSDNRLTTEAAAITFYALLSIFPALTALVSVYGLIADPATVSDQLAGFTAMMPGGATEMLTAQVKKLASHGSSQLGFGLVAGLAVSLWTANHGTKALVAALNVVNGEAEKRGFLLRTALTLGFTLGVVLFMVLAMAAVVAVPVALNLLGLGGTTGFLLRWLRWPLLLVVVTLLLAVVYRYGPSRNTAQWRWTTWGSGFAAIVWVGGSLVFSWFVANFGNYDETYGSLGAVIGFLTWVWLSVLVVLVGGQLNAELEFQTRRDSTTGPPQPMGRRGAVAADNVAGDSGVAGDRGRES